MTDLVPTPKICDSNRIMNHASSDADGAGCKFRDEYLTSASVTKSKSTAPAAPDGTSLSNTQTVSGKNVDVSVKVDDIDRGYQIYWPKNHSTTEKLPVVYAADGLSTSGSSPAEHLGVQDGLFAEADRDGFAVVTLEPKRNAYFGLGTVHMKFWNSQNSVLGFDAKQQDDGKYAAVVQSDLSKHANVDPSHSDQFCVGFSNGGDVCREMDVKSVALNASTKLDWEPQTKPGLSAVIFHGQEDEVLPYKGGLYGPWSRAGIEIDWVQHNLPNAQFDHSQPSHLLPDYVQANHLQPTETVDNQNFLKRSYGPNDTGVKVTEYQLKAPYGGHNYNGGHAEDVSGYLFSANTNVVPRNILDSTHIAVCFFGIRKDADCKNEGD
jgi:poly(3-hydroxybutyrate) depolymerase